MLKKLITLPPTFLTDGGPMAIAFSSGVSLKALRSNKETGESSILLKFEAAAGFPAHNRPGGEEVYAINHLWS